MVAFGTALVGAVATDTWQQVRAAVTGLWRRVHPHQADGIGTELDLLREDMVAARQSGDADTERDLEGAWRVKLQQLLRADPELAGELRRVLDQVLTPALAPAEQTRVQAIITGTASGRAHLSQAGGDVTTIGGDSYTAGRDQHLHKP
ncbi:hypothetical protein ABZV67_42155 [Streptomyces sp. NPDC005065]|uniref:hypothetical protein n=1 Tax=Streptomyces sp. NPDC005065 TaxID=3154461 RepID=UPI0033B6A0BC